MDPFLKIPMDKDMWYGLICIMGIFALGLSARYYIIYQDLGNIKMK